MKKGDKISKVVIDHEVVAVYNQLNQPIKVTRQQRNSLSNYRNPNYVEDVEKAFTYKGILAHDFTVVKDGVVKK